MPENEDKIKKITALLEKGGTMLATHHDCGAPLFRYKGKTMCPVCDFREEAKAGVVPEEEIKARVERKEEKEGGQGKSEPESRAARPKPQGEVGTVDSIIRNKIQEIAVSLEAEADLQRIKDKMECIEQGIKILKLLQD